MIPRLHALLVFPFVLLAGRTEHLRLVDPHAYIGGTRDLRPVRIATDAQGNTFVAGNFLWTNPSTPGLSGSDVFVMRLDSEGQIVYNTYFGGNGADTLTDMTIDATGRVYLVGRTGQDDAFIRQLTPTGGLLYSSTFGGDREDVANAVAVDAAGNVYVTGSTASPNFPVTSGAFQTRPVQPDSFRYPTNAFVMKMAANGGPVVYSTLLGGTKVECIGGSRCLPAAPADAGVAIAVDDAGNAYVAGRTNTLDFPVTTGALRTACSCTFRSPTGFVTKLNPSGTGLVFSTYLGGTVLMDFLPVTTISAMALDRQGSVYVTGSSPVPDFPTTPGAFRTAPDAARNSGQASAFVSKLSPDGRSLVYSTWLSGKGEESAAAIRVDAQGNAYVSGQTSVKDFPVTTGAFNRGGDFYTRLGPTGSTLFYSTLLPAGVARQGLTLDPQGNVLLLGEGGYVSRVEGATNRLPAILGITNAAADHVSGRISPGELIAILGTDIGPAQPAGMQLDASGKVATTLAGVQVMIDGIAAPITYAQKDQINAVVPFAVLWSGSTQPLLEVFRNSQKVGETRLQEVDAEPEVFKVVVNQNGTLNSATNPAKLDDIVTVYATGLGPNNGSSQDGEIRLNNLPALTLPVSLETQFSGVVNRAIEILYAGQAPGIVAGVMQINFRLPVIPIGDRIIFILMADGYSSQPFEVFVTE